MTSTVSTLTDMLGGLRPSLSPDKWVFTTVPRETLPDLSDPSLFALIRESEGLTVIQQVNDRPAEERATFARITLQVYSDLAAVGLTAAVSQTLANKGICANMVAGYHHDHVFVPYDQAEAALTCLEALSAAFANPAT